MISNQSQNATSEWLTIDKEIQSGKECKRKKNNYLYNRILLSFIKQVVNLLHIKIINVKYYHIMVK